MGKLYAAAGALSRRINILAQCHQRCKPQMTRMNTDSPPIEQTERFSLSAGQNGLRTSSKSVFAWSCVIPAAEASALACKMDGWRFDQSGWTMNSPIGPERAAGKPPNVVGDQPRALKYGTVAAARSGCQWGVVKSTGGCESRARRARSRAMRQSRMLCQARLL